jgi:hypothetical protein
MPKLYNRPMRPTPVLTLPNAESIADAVAAFDGQSQAVEHSLKELFGTYHSNSDFSHVLWKVVVLNRLYSTQVFAVEDLAAHIVSHATELDRYLQIGSPEAVDLFIEVDLGGKKRNLFSFATKFCSWHNQAAYPIYDSRVGWYLWNLQKQTKFCSTFTRFEFENYEAYKTVFLAFQHLFQLEAFDFKTLDKFLWFYGEPKAAKGETGLIVESGASDYIHSDSTDADFHSVMLASEEGNRLADHAGIDAAHEMGFSEEWITRNISSQDQD